MATEAANREAFRIQRFYCENMDAPVYARLCGTIADGLTRNSRTGARILDWPGEPTHDALPLRFIGGLHALVRSGADADLMSIFAGKVTDKAALVRMLNAAVGRHDDALLPWLDGPPQTNEPGRSGVLMLGLMEVARRHGPRLEVLEIGSSAGLNLLIDRYAFDLGGTRVGPNGAPVTIRPEWQGDAPEPVDVDILSVSGCDVASLDATDPQVAGRLQAYVWAEAEQRVERLRGALAMVREAGVDLVRADAADWLEVRLAEPQQAGVTRVLMHSVMWQYLPEDTANRIRAAMRAAAMTATADRPLGWIMMEPDRALAHQVLCVRSWPDHGEDTILATAHAHGAWVRYGVGETDRQSYTLPASARVTAG